MTFREKLDILVPMLVAGTCMITIGGALASLGFLPIFYNSIIIPGILLGVVGLMGTAGVLM